MGNLVHAIAIELRCFFFILSLSSKLTAAATTGASAKYKFQPQNRVQSRIVRGKRIGMGIAMNENKNGKKMVSCYERVHCAAAAALNSNPSIVNTIAFAIKEIIYLVFCNSFSFAAQLKHNGNACEN